ncbi:hypothetical protein [Actinoplanes sp. NPDC051411]|uniref:nSTAND1 domain-containing NTPase n=1 Tax=Actinoplanes sp. NPDC051411 TaxID=3155522 RepID=UPI0034321BE7
MTATLVARATALRDSGGVQLVVGASGSGKSSLLSADLLHRLRWRVAASPPRMQESRTA